MTVNREVFLNRWATTLASPMTIDTGTMVLTTVAGLPATGQIRFLLGSGNAGEKIIAHLNGTTTLTGCTRGAESSTASTHLAAEAVTAVYTAGGINNALDWARASLIVHNGEIVTHDGEAVYL